MANDHLINSLLDTSNSIHFGMSIEPLINSVEDFIEENAIIDLSGDIESCVQLDSSDGDEVESITLNSEERRCFILSELLSEYIESALTELQIACIGDVVREMRSGRTSYRESRSLLSSKQYLNHAEDVILLNKAMTARNLIQAIYEMSVRTRSSNFMHPTIVRKGFVLHMYELKNE